MISIDAYQPSQLDQVVALSLRAWKPVFASVREEMEPEAWAEYYPDWRAHQSQAVREACSNPKLRVWVATENGEVLGFTASKVDAESRTGEIYMIATDPAAQRRGIAAQLTQVSLDWFREEGMEMAVVDTGLDPGHAPARKTYAAAGFHLWPTARYYRKV